SARCKSSGCSSPLDKSSSSRSENRNTPPCTTRPRSGGRSWHPDCESRSRRCLESRSAQQGVGPCLGVSAALAVVHPVREAQRIVERHPDHRHALASRDQRVSVGPGYISPCDATVEPVFRTGHARVVQLERVGFRLSVPELSVLNICYFILPN